MSLLIDALRQAEETKQEAPAKDDEALKLGLQELLPTAAPVTVTPKTKPSSAAQAGRHKPVFVEPPPSPAKSASTRQALGFLAGIVLGIAFTAVMVLIWFSKTPASPPIVPPKTTATRSLPAKEAPTPQENQTSSEEEKEGEMRPSPMSGVTSKTPLEEKPGPDEPPKKTDIPADTRPHPADERKIIPFRQVITPERQDERLEQAFEAASRGQTLEARRLYREVLDKDPKSAEAFSGLGELALQSGQREEALRYFREALALNPKNASAHSQLLALASETDTNGAEARLQTLIAEQPDSAQAHFVLGNLYAREERWKEAQQAYFNAHALDPANPDLLYNLAVSLEHLHHPELACKFYEQAVEAAQARAAGFSQKEARARAAQLREAIQKEAP